jgi:hypothetical protein
MALDSLAPVGGLFPLVPALEQTALLLCLQYNRQDLAQQILNLYDAGPIVSWYYDDDTWPANYFVYGQGGQYGIVMTGTSNEAQMAGNVIGGLGRPYSLPAVLCNNFFALQGEYYLPIFQTLLPAVGTLTRLQLSGHSLGAAVCHWLGNEFAEVYGNDLVELFHLSGPKLLSWGYSGSQPTTFVRCCHTLDLVPKTPPAEANVVQLIPLQGTILGSTVFRWRHYGQGWEISQTETIDAQSPDDSLFNFPDVSIFSSSVNEHYIPNVITHLIHIWQRQDPPNPINQVIAIVADLVNMTSTGQTQVEINPDESTDFAAANATYFPSQGTVVSPNNVSQVASVAISLRGDSYGLMANTGFTRGHNMANPSGIWKFTYFYSSVKYGRSSSYVCQTSPTFSAAAAAATSLAGPLSWLLGFAGTSRTGYTISEASPSITWMRISDVINPRLSQLFPLGAPGSAGFGQYVGLAGNATGGADTASNALGFKLSATWGGQTGPPALPSQQLFDQHHVMFIPDGVLVNGSYVPTFALGDGSLFNTRFQNVITNLCNGTQSFGVAIQDPNQQKYIASNFASVYQPTELLYFQAAGSSYQVYDKITLSGCDVSQLNGKYTITQVVTNPTLTPTVPAGTYYVVRVKDLPPITPTVAKVQRYQLANGTRCRVFAPFDTSATGGPNSNVIPAFSKLNIASAVDPSRRAQRRKKRKI